MRVVKQSVVGLAWAILAVVFLIPTFPFVVIALGMGISGNSEACEWWMDHSPLIWLMERRA